MRIKKLVSSLMMALLLVNVIPTIGFAATLDEIESQQNTKEKEMAEIDSQINKALTKVNEKNSELEELTTQIEVLKETVQATSETVSEQEEVVKERLDQAKERILSMQTTEVNQNVVVSLFESESVTDLFNRAYVLVTLQSAGNDQLEIAEDEKQELADLKDELENDLALLENQTAEAKEQKEDLDTQVASLQKTMDENQTILNELDEQRELEESRIAAAAEKAAEEAKAKEEKAAAEKVAAEAALATKTEKEAAVVTTTTTESSNNQTETQKTESTVEKETTATTATTTPAESTETSSKGKSIVVSATGYSTKQANLSTHTATGINLENNPMVIAVDPRVIPLGSMVEIPGYGIFIAGDTGGAIKGNKIDIHFPSVQQANNFGRKTITINILN
ncbi:peptidoglycan-binding protein LysM [Carnobacterium viridans]|uniref:Cystine transport system substrate-binding protein n=1 Tax=Carnobacterium viridans TaxID=174587 RepID=A0A1H0Z254_9LACT|nr:3D domain-containing protein [Carnobacterium viridans]UDE94829.1 peptidoglycan-binding protein LysM [Carnobacterium viridans]SDQ21587.1 cystine transport system substrate-binding protein [Carnobacterium viridans]